MTAVQAAVTVMVVAGTRPYIGLGISTCHSLPLPLMTHAVYNAAVTLVYRDLVHQPSEPACLTRVKNVEHLA